MNFLWYYFWCWFYILVYSRFYICTGMKNVISVAEFAFNFAYYIWLVIYRYLIFQLGEVVIKLIFQFKNILYSQSRSFKLLFVNLRVNLLIYFLLLFWLYSPVCGIGRPGRLPDCHLSRRVQNFLVSRGHRGDSPQLSWPWRNSNPEHLWYEADWCMLINNILCFYFILGNVISLKQCRRTETWYYKFFCILKLVGIRRYIDEESLQVDDGEIASEIHSLT